MGAPSLAATLPVHAAGRRLLLGAAILAPAILAAIAPALAQQPQSVPQARIVVIGEGSVGVTPDYAEIDAGVTTRATTAMQATAANSKLMAAISAALVNSGIEKKDIQTSQFSVQPVYVSPQPNAEPKLTGFSVSNQVRVTVRQIGAAGQILDQLVTAGATNVGNIAFLYSDQSKALDQARQAAVADARRKAELYAHTAGLSLGSVVWITENSGYAAPMPMGGMRAAAAAPGVPIAVGEDTLQVRITVGFDIAR